MNYKLQRSFDQWNNVYNVIILLPEGAWTLWLNPKNHYMPSGYDSNGFRIERKLLLGPTITEEIMDEVKALVVKEML